MIWQGLDITTALQKALSRYKPESVFILCSEGSLFHASTTLERAFPVFIRRQCFVIPDGEKAKSLKTAEDIWTWLAEENCKRDGLLINIGGGAVCDVGGFCASSFMRGIEFWNVPSTLLAMVDASVGGKTGINLNSFKNYIGSFAKPSHVFIDPQFIKTQSSDELLSGWAEVIKHGVIEGDTLWKIVNEGMPETNDSAAWLEIIVQNTAIKARIVDGDFTELGARKLLNLGHTLGHAFESMAIENPSIQNPISHGRAIAWGLLLETEISVALKICDTEILQHIQSLIEPLYEKIIFTRQQVDTMLHCIKGDKKNTGNVIRLSLIRKVGDCVYDIGTDLLQVKQILLSHASH